MSPRDGRRRDIADGGRVQREAGHAGRPVAAAAFGRTGDADGIRRPARVPPPARAPDAAANHCQTAPYIRLRTGFDDVFSGSGNYGTVR